MKQARADAPEALAGRTELIIIQTGWAHSGLPQTAALAVDQSGSAAVLGHATAVRARFTRGCQAPASFPQARAKAAQILWRPQGLKDALGDQGSTGAYCERTARRTRYCLRFVQPTREIKKSLRRGLAMQVRADGLGLSRGAVFAETC